MNERDKELAEQADKFAKENRAQNIAALGNNYFELFHEKFADLIRADEREEILKLADSLGWVNVDDIRARGNA